MCVLGNVWALLNSTNFWYVSTCILYAAVFANSFEIPTTENLAV